MFSPVPTHALINNSSLSAGSASSSREGSRAGTPTAMEVIMNEASYIIIYPAALVHMKRAKLVSVEHAVAIHLIESNLQESSVNDLSSSKCSGEDLLDMEAPTEKGRQLVKKKVLLDIQQKKM
jgi:hypothetical protein